MFLATPHLRARDCPNVVSLGPGEFGPFGFPQLPRAYHRQRQQLDRVADKVIAIVACDAPHQLADGGGIS